MKPFYCTFVPLWIIVLGVICILFGNMFQQNARAQESDQTVETKPQITDPQWVVVYNFKRNNEQGEPLLNLRVVIHAASEGDAIVRATFYLNKQMGTVLDMEKVKYVDVGPMRVEEPKKK